MSQTSRLQLPFLQSGQAQKHVTVNETLLRLDALVQLAVISATTSAQPGSPSDGDIYILPVGKAGAAWSGMTDGALAYYRDGVWEELTPREGFVAHVSDADTLLIYSGAAWLPLAAALRFSGSDKLLGRVSSGAGAAEEVAFTDCAQALCDDASFQDMCATLGSWCVLARSAVATSITGTTSETALATISVPANALGPNGVLRVTTLWSYTNNANAKILRTRFGGIGGTAFDAITPTASASQRRQFEISNRNASNAQVALAPQSAGGWGASSSSVQTGVVDTASAQNLVLTGQLAHGADTITLQAYLVELAHGA